MFDDARSGDLPVFGDVTDKQKRGAATLGKADEFLRTGAHLADGAGGCLDGVGPYGLDRVDDKNGRRRAGFQGCQNIAQAGLGGKFNLRSLKPQSARPQACLVDAFLAGDIDGGLSGGCQRRKHLQQKRRFSNSGVTADQQRRSRDKPAATDAIKLADIGQQARRWLRCPCYRDEVDHAPTTSGTLAARNGAGVGLFAQRVPGTAAFATPTPFRIGRTTRLTDKAGRGFGHLSECNGHWRFGQQGDGPGRAVTSCYKSTAFAPIRDVSLRVLIYVVT